MAEAELEEPKLMYYILVRLREMTQRAMVFRRFVGWS